MTPTPVPFQARFAFDTKIAPSSVFEAGSLLAVNNVQPGAAVIITWANGAIGVSDAADNAPGEIAAAVCCTVSIHQAARDALDCIHKL
jgi:hypothetical protein